MKSKHLAAILPSTTELKTFLFAACVMVVGTASAATTGYVSNPTTNSVDWGNAVTSLGATVNTSVNFNGIAGTGAVTPTIGGFYTGTAGVTFSASSVNLAATMSPQGYTFSGEGEGVWAPSKLLVASSATLSATPAQSVTFTFANGVYGGGVFLVDLCCAQWTISARDINNNVLGSFPVTRGRRVPADQCKSWRNSQVFPRHLQYQRPTSRRLTIARPAMSMFVSGDTVGIDDLRFAVAATPTRRMDDVCRLAGDRFHRGSPQSQHQLGLRSAAGTAPFPGVPPRRIRRSTTTSLRCSMPCCSRSA